MAKEQIAVAELITNIILGKTDSPGRVDFFPQKPVFPFEQPYEAKDTIWIITVCAEQFACQIYTRRH